MTPNAETPNLPSQEYQTLLQMINGAWITQMLHAAARLGIADLAGRRRTRSTPAS